MELSRRGFIGSSIATAGTCLSAAMGAKLLSDCKRGVRPEIVTDDVKGFVSK